ncbi:MAG TPA: hypothetical protein VH185_06520 [Mycobacterium sp.]|nr:hypothetical protein [Mycobacterium sp.]
MFDVGAEPCADDLDEGVADFRDVDVVGEVVPVKPKVGFARSGRTGTAIAFLIRTSISQWHKDFSAIAETAIRNHLCPNGRIRYPSEH